MAFIVVVGLIRGLDFDDLVLLGDGDGDLVIPTGMPAFVSGCRLGAKQLAQRPRGGQEPHRRGDARCDERDQHRQDRHADDERDDGLDHLRGRVVVHRHGRGLREDGHDPVGRRSAGARFHPPGARAGPRHRRHRRRWSRRRHRRPDRGRARRAAAKLGVDAEETRRAYPRLAAVPFDSAYKFMATFHRVTVDGVEHVVELVKGGPDVVFARCTHAPAAR